MSNTQPAGQKQSMLIRQADTHRAAAPERAQGYIPEEDTVLAPDDMS